MTSAPKSDPDKVPVLGLADIRSPDILALVQLHHELAMAANSVCEGHALDAAAFQDPAITLFDARANADGFLLGIVALKVLNTHDCEIKTMHTREAARGQGIAEQLMHHVMAWSKNLGLSQLYLETGTAPYFLGATRLYEKMGFAPCPPFAAYEANPDSLFMQRAI